jgi:hypothetical protein
MRYSASAAGAAAQRERRHPFKAPHIPYTSPSYGRRVCDYCPTLKRISSVAPRVVAGRGRERGTVPSADCAAPA